MNCHLHSSRRISQARSPGGFSLIELLTVIAIISILLTVGAVGIGALTNGKNVTSALSSTEAIFAEARSLAVGKGTTTRVIVNKADPSDRDNYLRRVLILTQDLDANGVAIANQWSLNSRGFQLPDQVFFSQTLSKKSKDVSDKPPTMTLSVSSTIKKPYAGDYYYYEFNSEGVCSTPGATFVIGYGTRSGTGDPRVVGAAKRDFAGFVLWRNGTTSIFRSPDQIPVPSSTTTF